MIQKVHKSTEEKISEAYDEGYKDAMLKVVAILTLYNDDAKRIIIKEVRELKR